MSGFILSVMARCTCIVKYVLFTSNLTTHSCKLSIHILKEKTMSTQICISWRDDTTFILCYF